MFTQTWHGCSQQWIDLPASSCFMTTLLAASEQRSIIQQKYATLIVSAFLWSWSLAAPTSCWGFEMSLSRLANKRSKMWRTLMTTRRQAGSSGVWWTRMWIQSSSGGTGVTHCWSLVITERQCFYTVLISNTNMLTEQNTAVHFHITDSGCHLTAHLSCLCH